jgi:hypothetical protein
VTTCPPFWLLTGHRARACASGWPGSPDPRSPLGRWHPLEFVLALAVCAFTAAGHDSPSAIADWASGCSREILAVLGGRRDPWTGQVRPPCERTFRRVFARIDAAALNDAIHAYLAALPQAAPGDLAEAARHEREQRRAAAQARKPAVPGMRPQAEDLGARYLMIAKANQPALPEQVIAALSGADAEFADASWAEDGKGHGRREKRSIRTAPADNIDWPGAAQVLRIRRDTGPTHGPWASKEIAYGITSLPADLAGPRHLAMYARQHWGVENRQHYVRDVTFREDAQKARTGNQANAYAAIRNLVMGAFRRQEIANIAHVRRSYGRDDQRILTRYGYP